MKIKLILSAGAVGIAALTASAFGASPVGATATNCSGSSSTGAWTGAVVVPAGATCTLGAADTVTDVVVYGRLTIFGGTVDSVTAYGPVTLASATVRHATVLSGITAGPSLICSSHLGDGGLVLDRNVSAVSVKPNAYCPLSTSVGGNVKMLNNTGAITLSAVSVTDYCFGTGNASVTVGALTTLDGERRGQCVAKAAAIVDPTP